MKDGFVAVPIGFTLVIGWLAYVGALPTGATVGFTAEGFAGFCITGCVAALSSIPVAMIV